jgi:hypothetical protein
VCVCVYEREALVWVYMGDDMNVCMQSRYTWAILCVCVCVYESSSSLGIYLR